jgi:hypothetical protein
MKDHTTEVDRIDQTNFSKNARYAVLQSFLTVQRLSSNSTRAEKQNKKNNARKPSSRGNNQSLRDTLQSTVLTISPFPFTSPKSVDKHKNPVRAAPLPSLQYHYLPFCITRAVESGPKPKFCNPKSMRPESSTKGYFCFFVQLCYVAR